MEVLVRRSAKFHSPIVSRLPPSEPQNSGWSDLSTVNQGGGGPWGHRVLHADYSLFLRVLSMESNMALMSTDDGKEEAIVLPSEVVEVEDEYAMCLVGRFLTSSVIYFLSMRNTLANVWHPLRAISITNIGAQRICFWFYHEVDLLMVLEGCPWFFNNHLLLLHRLAKGEDPLKVTLEDVVFWVQVHDLPSGLMYAHMARKFGNFVGQFIDYDSKLVISGRKQYLRVNVLLNVNHPLKRKKKIVLGLGCSVYAHFQYEKLSLFCFICGKLGHGESFCPLRLTMAPSEVVFGWNLSI
ncbi:hypothetical protein V6N13_010071 [Hibiscus sabdariffa]